MIETKSVLLEEDEIAVIFHKSGEMTTSRGIVDPGAYANVKQVFIMKADSPLYRISDYWGYQQIHKSWKEVK